MWTQDDPNRERQVNGLLSLDMVTIQVGDWEAAVSWHTGVLGLSVVLSGEDDRFCILRAPEGGATWVSQDLVPELLGELRTPSWLGGASC